MSFLFHVFLSYARSDYSFALELAESLKRLGLEVWLDEEQILPGEAVQASLVRGLESAQHAVFVVTDAWLDRVWTEWELESFVQDRTEGRRLVPVLRIPRDVKRIGPYLRKLQPVEWPEGDPESEARLWELRCGILGEPLGPRKERARRWRELLVEKAGPALMAKTPAEKTTRILLTLDRGIAKESLTLDRKAQWGQLTTEAARPVHQAIFVLGPQRRGHEVFLDRVKLLPKDPPRAIYPVHWSLTPNAKGLFFDALARALDCPAARLAATLRAELEDKNVVLLHRPVCEKDFEDETFLAYYTTWLPELIAEVDPDPRHDDRVGALKMVQGIAWCPSSPVQRGLAWLGRRIGIGGDRIEAALQRSEALRALASIRSESERRRTAGQPWLSAVCLDELPEITREDVLEWSDVLPPGEREKFVKGVMFRAHDSEQILERIVNRLKKEDG